MTTPTKATTPAAIDQATLYALLRDLFFLIDLDEVDPADILSVHLGTKRVSVRRLVRGRRGRVVEGMTTTTSHIIRRQPVEEA